MAGGGGDNEYEVGINLTALLDVLTNLLFFLMFGFAAQQISIDVEGGVRLPDTSAQVAPKRDINVSVGRSTIKVDDKQVAVVRNGEIEAPLDAQGRIGPLYQVLSSLHANTSARTDGDVLLVLCDKDVPYATLRKVLMTAAEAGFAKYRLAGIMQ